MRLNWSLHHSPITNKNFKPIIIEEYTENFGLDLNIPKLIDLYILICRYEKPSPQIGIYVKKVYEKLDKQTSKYASKDICRAWLGINLSYQYYPDNTPREKRIHLNNNDRALVFEACCMDKTNMAHYFRLRITQDRYPDYCPLEYYYSTRDIPEIG